jgi:prefoldin subunit 5
MVSYLDERINEYKRIAKELKVKIADLEKFLEKLREVNNAK